MPGPLLATFGTLTLRAMAIPFCCCPGQAVEVPMSSSLSPLEWSTGGGASHLGDARIAALRVPSVGVCDAASSRRDRWLREPQDAESDRYRPRPCDVPPCEAAGRNCPGRSEVAPLA